MKKNAGTITSRDNRTVKKLKKLGVSAKERKSRGATLLDSPRLVETYVRHGGVPLLVVAGETAAEERKVRNLIRKCEDTPFIVLSDSVFREVSPVKNPGGLMAMISIPESQAGSPSGDSVMLEDLQDPGNLGMILRSAAAAGVRKVFLSPGCTDAWSPKALRAGMGAHFVLNVIEEADLVAVTERYEGVTAALDTAGGRNLYETDLSGPTAFLIGNEGAGLSSSLAGAARERITIPMTGWEESLNAAAAAAIALFEMVRQRQGGTPR